MTLIMAGATKRYSIKIFVGLCLLSCNLVQGGVLVNLRDELLLKKPVQNSGDAVAVDDNDPQADLVSNNYNGSPDDTGTAAGTDNAVGNDSGIKHVDHIPVNENSARRAVPNGIQEGSDDETFETLEANREYFLEILNDNAKHPHRKKSSKKHNRDEKMVLKFDAKTQKWTLTEKQSDEWF